MKMLYGSLQEIGIRNPLLLKKLFTCVCRKMRFSEERPPGRVIVSFSPHFIASSVSNCQHITQTHAHTHAHTTHTNCINGLLVLIFAQMHHHQLSLLQWQNVLILAILHYASCVLLALEVDKSTICKLLVTFSRSFHSLDLLISTDSFCSYNKSRNVSC